MAADYSTEWVANALGYLIGLGSLILYSPIVIRLFRQKTAYGTSMSTWMMKLSSHTCTDLYSSWQQYPLSTYIDALVITAQSAIILALVTIYQQQYGSVMLWVFLILYVTAAAYLYWESPPDLLSLGQLSAAILNSGALVSQFVLNCRQKSIGDYSPVTVALAATGNAIRFYTILVLADSDAILLFTSGIASLLNIVLLFQIVYFGLVEEGLSLGAVFSADIVTTTPATMGYAAINSGTTSLPVQEERSCLSRFAVLSPMALFQGRNQDGDDDDDDDVGSSISPEITSASRGRRYRACETTSDDTESHDYHVNGTNPS